MNLLKKPAAFGILVLSMVAMQVGASYLSAVSFFENDIVLGLSFFLMVPALGLILGFYIIWFRKIKSARVVAGEGRSPSGGETT